MLARARDAAHTRPSTVFTFLRPSDEALDHWLARGRDAALSYDPRALEHGRVPTGWDLDHHRVRLGVGIADFLRARAALERWAQFDLGWVELYPRSTPIERGANVVVLVRVAGLLFKNDARIVSTVDEPGARFGFAYGTLARHSECGEESFAIELDPKDGSVWYDLRARSRPRRYWVRLARPWVRHLQRRFAIESLAAMQRAVRG